MIDDLAKKLYERIKQLLRQGYTIKEMKELLLQEFGAFNEEVQRYIEDEIFKELDSVPPEVLVGPKLSETLYSNAVEAVAVASKLIKEHIKSKRTIRELAHKLYEGYGFRDKEVLEVKKSLPKYITKELGKPNVQQKLLRKINRLKTSPLRAAYTQIVDSLEKTSQDALEKALKTAVAEKARYYATRIAQTEIFRAKNYKNAVEYLEDEGIEFVRYEMSSSHPKTDICDFYANLDIGYGKGIVPKEQMRTLPMHPFCRCKYVPVYLTSYRRKEFAKVRPKSFKEAQKETMAKFSKKQQREIVGSYEKLAEFVQGKDIEELFNRLRPKYPIRKYTDVVGYNSKMKHIEQKILSRVAYFEANTKEEAVACFAELWHSRIAFEKHVRKRLDEGVISDEYDYLQKTIECLAEADEYILAAYEKSWDRLRYASNGDWFVIFNEDGIILTSHKKDETKMPFEQKHAQLGAKLQKGKVDEKFREVFKSIQAKLGKL